MLIFSFPLEALQYESQSARREGEGKKTLTKQISLQMKKALGKGGDGSKLQPAVNKQRACDIHLPGPDWVV